MEDLDVFIIGMYRSIQEKITQEFSSFTFNISLVKAVLKAYVESHLFCHY